MLFNTGLVYDKLNENKKALDYFNKALEMRQWLYDNDQPDLALSLNSVGLSYFKLNENKKANLKLCLIILRLLKWLSNQN